MKVTPTVVLSSVGRRVELLRLFREAMDAQGGGRIVALDMSPLSSAVHFADVFHQVPACRQDDFLPVVEGICRQERADLLIPLIDTELSAMASGRERLAAAGVLTMVSGQATVKLCHDKVALSEYLMEHEVPVPEHVTDLRQLASGKWSGDLVVKPRFGSSSIGMVFTDAAHVGSLGELSLEEVVLQRRIVGTEYSVDVFVDGEGEIRSAFVREQVELRAGETSKGRSVVNIEVRDAACAAVASLPDAFGVIHADVIVERDSGVPRILELNARFPGGFPLSHRAGSPVIPWLLSLANGVTPDFAEPTARPVTMLRYELGVYLGESGEPLE